MTTRLEGDDTRFLPFNRGTKDGASGNDEPEDIHRYATDYLWRDVLIADSEICREDTSKRFASDPQIDALLRQLGLRHWRLRCTGFGR
jgi:hypothetical protein